VTLPAQDDEDAKHYWFARHSKSIIFLIGVLTVVGVWQAFTLPVSVFPTTNFPRVIIGVDNGVMPIEQMEVTITRPLEAAVRAVPGIETVRSVTSRGSAEIDLAFSWSVNTLETLQMVDAAVSRVQSTLPSTAQIRTNRLDFASFPIIGYSLTSNTLSQKDLWELATYDIQPRLNSLPGVATVLVQGGQRPEYHVVVDPPLMLRAKTSIADIVSAINRTNVVDSPGLLNRNHQLFLGLVTAQAHSPEDVGQIVIKHVNNIPVRVQDVGAVTPTGLHSRQREWQTGGAAQRESPARQQHRAGGR
jgi:multidrug efflux pump subunit AcrB